MACNDMFGNGDGDLIAPPNPGRLFRISTAEVVIYNREVLNLMRAMRCLVDMAKVLPVESSRGAKALSLANEVINLYERRELDWLPKAQSLADEFFGSHGAPDRFVVSAVGNCHIDTAWLWRYRETRRKTARSWSSQLRLMERWPEYRFACSQMAQLDWLRVDYPELFERICAKAKAGQFIPIGGSWVEMDGNLPSGESFARQFLYGQRFALEHFGEASSVFWLPDTFGYHAQLPQLMRLAGMRFFLTQKLSWNNINKFPHNTFQWEGLDGTKVLVHFPPADTYTSPANVNDIRKSEVNCKDLSVTNEAMLLFGHGDGGGGPTESMLDTLTRLNDVDGLPVVRFSDPTEVFERLNAQFARLPSWYGELYLEFHRGTYTSQGKIKYYNRKCEGLLREAEMVSAVYALVKSTQDGDAYPYAGIEHLWKMVLLNQFHDVLPGSSIEDVYHDASKIYQSVEFEASKLRELALRGLFGIHNNSGVRPMEANKSPSIVFFNPTPFDRSEVLVVPFDANPEGVQPGVIAVNQVKGMAMSTLSLQPPPPLQTAVAAGVNASQGGGPMYYIENGHVRAEFDERGLLVSLFDKRHHRQAIAPGAYANSLWIYEDRPNYWDAWDLEVFHLETGVSLDDRPTSVVIGMEGPLLASLVRTVQLTPDSKLVQVISLNCFSPTLDFFCSIDWAEGHRILKVLFPVAVRAPEATFECPYGQVARPTHRNTSWDVARFEVPGHRFADLSEHGYGVALLTESKYGYSVLGSLMAISLLRAPKAPDATCDMSRHIIRFGLYPHAGNCTEGDVVGEAYRFNNPLRWTSVPPAAYDKAWLDTPFLEFKAAPSPSALPPLILDTLKMAEDRSGALIIRAYEAYGGRGMASLASHPLLRIATLEAVTLLESAPSDDLKMPTVKLANGTWYIFYEPFQVITLKATIQFA